MLKEATKKPHRVQVMISLKLICVQMYFSKTALIVVFPNRIACRSVQSHACSVCFQYRIEDFTDTILCHFTAVFHVVFRCFIIGRR